MPCRSLIDDAARVMVLVNCTLGAGVVVNLAYLVYDARWWRALGELTTASLGLVTTLRILQIFPFDSWQPVIRVLLIVALVGGGIGVPANVVNLMAAPPAPP